MASKYSSPTNPLTHKNNLYFLTAKLKQTHLQNAPMSSLETEVSLGRVKLLCEKLDFKLDGCDGHGFANHSIAFMRLTHAAKRKRRVRRSLQIERDRKTNKHSRRNIKPGQNDPTIKLLWREKGKKKKKKKRNCKSVKCPFLTTTHVLHKCSKCKRYQVVRHMCLCFSHNQSKEKQNNFTEAEMSADELFVSSPFHKRMYILPVPVIGRER